MKSALEIIGIIFCVAFVVGAALILFAVVIIPEAAAGFLAVEGGPQ